MGESEAGSSPAQTGHDDPDDSESRGFFGRIMHVFNTSDDEESEADAPRAVAGAPQVILPGLANLARMKVEDVAIPEAEITAVPVEIGRDELVSVFRESGFSRLPVYGETLDHPLGLLLLKDLALEYGFNGGTAREMDLKPLLRPLLYVPPSMPLAVLLQKMQAERMHMALVIDEYGGVVGLVTIEDLIEQVVGEIEDEHDMDEEGLWQEEVPGCWMASARAPLDEFIAETGLPLAEGLDDEEVDTLGGVVVVLTGRVPARGEVVSHPAGVEFDIVDADPRRIKRLRVRRTSERDAGRDDGAAAD
ncbi:magnesium/cobalt efflux protein [Rhodobacteraceae bacterium WD3A24]|nr:magnesium/cobalt efflux protein [Rhodobacteraceae bacterium WD3A24]